MTWTRERGGPNAWRARGVVRLWRYLDNERNYPGWHMRADADGYAALLELLAAFRGGGSAYRTLDVTPPDARVLRGPNNGNGHARWWAPRKWRIAYDAGAQRWDFPPEGDLAMLTLGAVGLDELAEGVALAARGGFDYAVGSGADDAVLWFW